MCVCVSIVGVFILTRRAAGISQFVYLLFSLLAVVCGFVCFVVCVKGGLARGDNIPCRLVE